MEGTPGGNLRFAHPSHCASLVGPSRSRGHGRPRVPPRVPSIRGRASEAPFTLSPGAGVRSPHRPLQRSGAFPSSHFPGRQARFTPIFAPVVPFFGTPGACYPLFCSRRPRKWDVRRTSVHQRGLSCTKGTFWTLSYTRWPSPVPNGFGWPFCSKRGLFLNQMGFQSRLVQQRAVF